MMNIYEIKSVEELVDNLEGERVYNYNNIKGLNGIVYKSENGIETLRDSTLVYKNLVDEIKNVVPYADNDLKTKLDETSLSLKNLLKELLKYF